jgi:hypothetical protein
MILLVSQLVINLGFTYLFNYILFKMRMKVKTYEINFLIASHLQVKSLSHMFWLSFSSWKVYKQCVLSLHFHI